LGRGLSDFLQVIDELRQLPGVWHPLHRHLGAGQVFVGALVEKLEQGLFVPPEIVVVSLPE